MQKITFKTSLYFIKYRPDVALHLGSQNAAILYQRLYDLRSKGSRKDGFIYKSVEELTDETGLSRREQEGARRLLQEKGWLDIKKIRAKGHATLHYKTLVELVEKTPTNAPNVQTKKHETYKLDAPNRQTNNSRRPVDNTVEGIKKLYTTKGMEG